MQAKIKKFHTYTSLEKTLIKAGVSVIALACLSSVFYAYTNKRFIADQFPSLFYYLSNLIILGGGFLTGYLLIKPRPSKQARLFNGVCYALLAAALYFIYELLRVTLQHLIGDFEYPYSRYVFELGPLVTVLVTAALAVIFQLRTRTSKLTFHAAYTLIIAFTAYQLYSFSQVIFYLFSEPNSFGFADTPLWIIASSFILHPLVVAAISYLALARVSLRLNRILYAVIIASLSSWLTILLWGFRSDASNESTTIFQAFTTIITICATGLLILKARESSRHK